MFVDEYLAGYRTALERIYELDLDIREQEEAMCHIIPGYSDLPGGGDSLEHKRNAEARLGDLNLSKQRMMESAAAIRQDISEFISRLRPETTREKKAKRALRLFYVGRPDIGVGPMTALSIGRAICSKDATDKSCERKATEYLAIGRSMSEEPYRRMVARRRTR